MNAKKITKRAIVNRNKCVACGCCVKVCPKGIIKIKYGVEAVILREECVGCGKCKEECPASAITMEELL